MLTVGIRKTHTMRHRKKFNHLSRKSAHRKAMLANMASSLLTTENKRIITTLAKAKALRTYVEPLITRAKSNTTHSRRTVFRYLQNKYAVDALFGEVASRIGDRPGGYTRVLKIGPRKGDNAEMALIELVDFNEFAEEKPKKKASRRRKKSGGGKKKAAAAPVVEEVKDDLVETVTDAEDVVEDVVADAKEEE